MLDTLDDTLDEVRERAVGFVNADGRSSRHVVLGVGLAIGTALLASAVANGVIKPSRLKRSNLARGEGAVTERPKGAFGLILPAVFSATTLSAVRVWNAPSAPARRTAIQLWTLAQGVNAAWLAARPRSLPAQVLAAMSTAGLAAAFAHFARKLDQRAGELASPFGSTARVANRISETVDDQPTVH